MQIFLLSSFGRSPHFPHAESLDPEDSLDELSLDSLDPDELLDSLGSLDDEDSDGSLESNEKLSLTSDGEDSLLLFDAGLIRRQMEMAADFYLAGRFPRR